MKYLSYLPGLFAEIEDYISLGEAFDQELERFQAAVDRLAENYFVKSTDEQGCVRWEGLLGIPPESSLEDRRKSIQTKLVTRVPINLEVIRGVAENYLGLSVTLKVRRNWLEIWYRGESRTEEFSLLYKTLYELIPASLLCEIRYRYLIWRELDEQKLSFAELAQKQLTWTELERGIWTGNGTEPNRID